MNAAHRAAIDRELAEHQANPHDVLTLAEVLPTAHADDEPVVAEALVQTYIKPLG